MRAPFFLALAGCSSVSGSQVAWGGYVFADPYVDETLLAEGRIELLTPEGTCVARDGACVVAEESETDGYYSLSVDKGSDAVLRILGPEVAPTVWRGMAPAATSAQWFSGALYTRRLDALESLGAALGPSGPAAALSDAETVWLWGAPLEPEAWADADLAVVDGDGGDGSVVGLVLSQDGTLGLAGSGPVDFFVAFDLSPGTVTFSVTAVDGRSASQSWPAQAGDLVSADFFALSLD